MKRARVDYSDDLNSRNQLKYGNDKVRLSYYLSPALTSRSFDYFLQGVIDLSGLDDEEEVVEVSLGSFRGGSRSR